MNLGESKEEIIEKKMDLDKRKEEIVAIGEAIETELEFSTFDENEEEIHEIRECIEKLGKLKREFITKTVALKHTEPTTDQTKDDETTRKVAEKIKELRMLEQRWVKEIRKKGKKVEDEMEEGKYRISNLFRKFEETYDAKKVNEETTTQFATGVKIEAAAAFPLSEAQRGESVAPSLNLPQAPIKENEEAKELGNETKEKDVENEEIDKEDMEENDSNQKTVKGMEAKGEKEFENFKKPKNIYKDLKERAKRNENSVNVESSKEEQMENGNIGKREAKPDGVGKIEALSGNGIEHSEDDIILDTGRINGKSTSENSDADEDEEISLDRKRVSKKASDLDEKVVVEVSDEDDQKFGANEDGKDEFARKSRKEHLADENPVVKFEIVEDVLEHDTKLLPHRDKLDAGMLIEVAASFPLLQDQRGESVAPSLNLIQSPTKAVESVDNSVRENELEEEDVTNEAVVANRSQADDKEQKVARQPALIIAKLEDDSMRVEVMANLDGNGITSEDMLSWIKMDIEYVQALVVIAAQVNMNVSGISYNPFVEYVGMHEGEFEDKIKLFEMEEVADVNVENYSLEKRKEKLSNIPVAFVYTGQFDPGIRDSIELNESSDFVTDSGLVVAREGIGVYKDNASTHTPSKFCINSRRFLNFDKLLELLETGLPFSGEPRRASVQLSGGIERGMHGREVPVERLKAEPQCSGHPAYD